MSGIMGITVYYFNINFFNPNAQLTTKLITLFANISIGVLVYIAISRIIQNQELAFLIDLIRNRKKKLNI